MMMMMEALNLIVIPSLLWGLYPYFLVERGSSCNSRWVVIGSIRVPPALKQRWPPNDIFTLVLSVSVLCLDVLLAGTARATLWGFPPVRNSPAVEQGKTIPLEIETICQDTQADRTQPESMLRRRVAPLDDNLRLRMWVSSQQQGETLLTTEERVIGVADISSDRSDCSQWLMSSSPSVSCLQCCGWSA